MNSDRVSSRGWLVIAMLFSFMLINFADKAILGLSAVPIMRDLGLDHTQFGLVGTSFFIFFSLSAVLIGFVVNRVSTRWVLFAMALSWAVVQLPMIVPAGIGLLVANRVLLGLGEGPAYPVALHNAYTWFPDARRPLPTSIIALGGAVGTGVVAPLIVYVIVTYSWRVAFAMLGVVGLAWCLVWLAVGREGPLLVRPHAADPAASRERVPYAALLTCRTFVGQTMLGFSAYWLLTLAVVWLPAYLTKGVGYTPTETGWIVTLPAFTQILLMPTVCAVSERLTRAGVSSRIARGGLACLGVFVAGVLAVALPRVTGAVLPIVCVAVAFSSGAMIFALGGVMIPEFTPPAQRGAMLGIGTAVATLAGPLAPVVMGMVVDSGANAVQGFASGFTMTGAAVAIVAVVAAFLINPQADRQRLLARAVRNEDTKRMPASA